MSLFLTYFRLAFKDRYAYKFDFYISIIASIMVLFVQVNVWQALYRSSSLNTDTTSVEQMITYVFISSILFNLTRSEAAGKIGRKVEDGSIVADFIRPVNFKNFVFAEDLGSNVFQVLFITLPAVLIGIISYGVEVPISTDMFILFLGSVLLGVLISFYIKYIIALFVFWLETSWYIPFFIGAVFELFSGSTIPLWFYPDWLQNISMNLPFRFTFFEPISIYLGNRTWGEAWEIIVVQFIWLVVLYAFERLVWWRAKQKVVVHGG